MQEVTTAALASAFLLTAATRFSPLLTVRRWLIKARAVCLVLPIGARAAWNAMCAAWDEAERYARREA